MGILAQLSRRIVWRRLAEPSTWAGIVTLATSFLGVTLDGDQRDAVIAAGVAIVGLLSVFIREASPSQVAKSVHTAATGEDKTDAQRVRDAVAVAPSVRDSHGRVRNVPADDPRSQ